MVNDHTSKAGVHAIDRQFKKTFRVRKSYGIQSNLY